LGTCCIGVPDRRQRSLRNAVAVDLLPDLAPAANGHYQLLREGVDHGDADAVQSAGYLVAVVVELPARMKDGHDHFRCRYSFLVDIRGDTPSVVLNGDGFVGMDGDADISTVPREGFVDGVVHHFEHHMVQAGSVVGVADIHAGAFTHRIKAL